MFKISLAITTAALIIGQAAIADSSHISYNGVLATKKAPSGIVFKVYKEGSFLDSQSEDQYVNHAASGIVSLSVFGQKLETLRAQVLADAQVAKAVDNKEDLARLLSNSEVAVIRLKYILALEVTSEALAEKLEENLQGTELGKMKAMKQLTQIVASGGDDSVDYIDVSYVASSGEIKVTYNGGSAKSISGGGETFFTLLLDELLTREGSNFNLKFDPK